ncbi:hypothetical protein F4779DRAFT_590186 [Xylariaceae sp. FL0662B]|nr:hypothetical protein F4779DRAFT_590186 [Xylariaceae sp. FL0662B]
MKQSRPQMRGEAAGWPGIWTSSLDYSAYRRRQRRRRRRETRIGRWWGFCRGLFYFIYLFVCFCVVRLLREDGRRDGRTDRWTEREVVFVERALCARIHHKTHIYTYTHTCYKAQHRWGWWVRVRVRARVRVVVSKQASNECIIVGEISWNAIEWNGMNSVESI